MGKWGGKRRAALGLVGALVLGLAWPTTVAAAAGGPVPNLAGTWSAQGGTPWTFTGSSGSYTATYHGTGPHSKLVGTATGTFEGSTLSGSIHIEEPNQVEGGPATVAEATFTFDYSYRGAAHLRGDIVAPSGTYPTSLTCQSGPCEEKPCSFVKAPEDRKETKQEAALADDLDFLLASRFAGADSCVVRLQRGTAEGGGSAVVLSQEGLLLTNAHVVEGVDRGTAHFADGTATRVHLVGADPLSDLAVVRSEESPVQAARVCIRSFDRWVRRRSRAEPGEPDGRGRHGAAPVGPRHQDLQADLG